MSLNEDVVDEQKALQALRKFFSSELAPVDTIGDESFKGILQMLDPRPHVSINQIGLKCLEIYEDQKAKMMEIIRNLDRQVSLSVDILHSVKPRECGSDYLCLKVYFVDDDWELKQWILDCIRVGHQSEDSPHQIIRNSLKDWGIENKISTITMPNSSLYGETVELVKDYVRGEKELQLDGRIFGVYCSSDIVSLIVQDANKAISDILDKIAAICEFTDPEPSWYNKNNQIKEALLLESAGEFSYRYRGSWYDKPSKEEWEKVDSVNRLLDDIYDMVFPLFEIGYSTANVYLHHLQELWAYLVHKSSRSNNFLSSVMKKLLETFGKYMTDMYLVLAIASVMDPRYKMRYMEFSSQKFRGNNYSKPTVEMVLQAVSELYVGYVKLGSDSSDGLSLLREYTQFLVSTTPLKSELDLYLEEPVVEWSEDFNALSWWKGSSSKYPTVSKMARDILAIPISLATSDKAFYTQKREVDEHLVSLGPDFTNALMCIQSWFPKQKRREGHLDDSSPVRIIG